MKAGQIIAPEQIEIVEAERPDLALADTYRQRCGMRQ